MVVGFAPEGPSGIAKLRLARRDGGALVYVGRVDTGWDRKDAAAIRRRVGAARASYSREADQEERHRVVEPVFEAEITCVEITDDGMIRHPSFRALRQASRR